MREVDASEHTLALLEIVKEGRQKENKIEELINLIEGNRGMLRIKNKFNGVISEHQSKFTSAGMVDEIINFSELSQYETGRSAVNKVDEM